MKKRKPASSQPPKPQSFLRDKKAKKTPSMAGGGRGMMEADQGRGMEEMNGRGDEMGEMMRGMGGEMEDMRGMMGGMGGRGAEPEYKDQPAEVIASRRQLNFVLQQLYMGATGSPSGKRPSVPGGLLVAATDADRESVESWVATLEDVIQAINEPALETEEEYLEEIELQFAVIQGLLPAEMRAAEKGTDAAAPQPADVFDLDDPLADLDGL